MTLMLLDHLPVHCVQHRKDFFVGHQYWPLLALFRRHLVFRNDQGWFFIVECVILSGRNPRRWRWKILAEQGGRNRWIWSWWLRRQDFQSFEHHGPTVGAKLFWSKITQVRSDQIEWEAVVFVKCLWLKAMECKWLTRGYNEESPGSLLG